VSGEGSSRRPLSSVLLSKTPKVRVCEAQKQVCHLLGTRLELAHTCEHCRKLQDENICAVGIVGCVTATGRGVKKCILNLGGKTSS
jgi:hypothetical protein